MDLYEIECRVTGKVQRVMYRDFVQRKARGLRLAGEVENMRDWSVRIVAQGSKDDLEALIQHLYKGPFLARVSSVDVVWRKPSKEFSGFTIVHA